VVSFLLPKRAPRSGERLSALHPAYPGWTSPSSAQEINLTFDAAGVCTDARVSIGAVAERALLVHEGTAALIGSTIDEHALKRMAAARERGG
jgi:carbon-monoxide dehydrogenase medium subunit